MIEKEQGIRRVESEESEKKKNLSELFRERIVKPLADLFQGEDPDIVAFEKSLRESADLSRSAGEFFGALSRNQEKSTPGRRSGVYDELSVRMPKLLREFKKANSAELLEMAKLKLKEKLTPNQESSSVVEEEVRVEDGVEFRVQKVDYVFAQHNSDNVVLEHVENVIEGEENGVHAKLRLASHKSGLGLDLGQLLPSNHIFVPGSMAPVDDESLDTQSDGFMTDLRQYSGTKDSVGEFATVDDGKGMGIVTYGDLTEKGGLISLLHEIAHSHTRQASGEGEAKRTIFQEYYNYVAGTLAVINEYFEEYVNDKISSEEVGRRIAIHQEVLAKMGVEFEIKTLGTKKDKLDEDEIELLLAAENFSGSFIVKSEKMKELLRDYELEERDAWAHAIKVLRFLRKQGFDVEPEIRTLKDVQGYIEPRLESYQKTVESLLRFKDQKPKFLRNS